MMTFVRGLFSIFLISGVLTYQVFGLSLSFVGANYVSQPDTSISAISLINHGSDFSPGDYCGHLPDATSAAQAGLLTQSGITVRCLNTNDFPWALSVRTSGFRHNQDTIPAANFRVGAFYARVENSLTYQDSTQSTTLMNNLKTTSFSSFESDRTLYMSDSSIDTNHTRYGWDGTKVQVEFDVLIPADQPAGTYTADLVFTLTQ